MKSDKPEKPEVLNNRVATVTLLHKALDTIDHAVWGQTFLHRAKSLASHIVANAHGANKEEAERIVDKFA
jgi:hypothetical protein